MELFVINRYTGDESINNQTPNESELRNKLLQRIEERKRLSQGHENDIKNKKRKKSVDFKSDDVDIYSSDKEDVKKKKKKKIIIPEEASTNKVLQHTEDLEIKSQKPKIQNIRDDDKKLKAEKNTQDSEPLDNIDYSNKVDKEEILDDLDKKTNGFTILGDVHMSKKEKVKRKLPDWLINPSVVSVDLQNLTCTIRSIPELDDIFIKQLQENNITHFFPVQSQIIPWFLKNANRPYMYWPNDICVSAPTGSGKTLAFVLPILQVLYKRTIKKIRALVVLPVQDLATQVFKVFENYSKPTDLSVLLLSKKRVFEEEQSLICKNDGLDNYKTLVDIIVTTPGRLVEHLTRTKGLCLDDLTYLVIDEADRVMEKVQNDWLYHLNKHINSECTRSYQVAVISYNNMVTKKRPPNKLLFSATLSQDPEKLQQLGLFQPKLFTSVVKSNTGNKNDETKFIGKYTTPAELKEYYANSTKASKPLIIHHLVNSKQWKNVLCFVNSSETTSRLAFILKRLGRGKIKVGKLSANLAVAKRNIVLQKFANGELDLLVSSDALARGIDIPNVQYVISYDAPKFIKTYVHRIGRTGRAGKEGTSLVLLTSKEVNHFQKMVESAGKTLVKELEINSVDLESYEMAYEKSLSSLGIFLENQKQKILQKDKKTRRLKLEAAKGKLNKIFKKPVKKENKKIK